MASLLEELLPQLRTLRVQSGRAVRALFPTGPERELAAELGEVTATLPRVAAEMLEKVRPRFDTPHTDADDDATSRDDPDEIRSAVESAREDSTRRTTTRVRRAATKSAARVANANKVQVQAQLSQAGLPTDPFAREPWLEDEVKASVARVVGSFENLEAGYFDKLSRVLVEGYTSGKRWEEIEAQLGREFTGAGAGAEKVQKSAGFIARNQVGTLNSVLTQRRQKDAGVEKYRWRTARDERVRGNPVGKYPDARYSHFAREGKVFAWSDPPPDGHPGEPPLCRCIAEPVIEEAGDDGQDQAPQEFTAAPGAFAGGLVPTLPPGGRRTSVLGLPAWVPGLSRPLTAARSPARPVPLRGERLTPKITSPQGPPVQFKRSSASVMNREVLVEVDLKALDKAWRKDPTFYVGRGGAGGIGNRYQAFGVWLEQRGEAVEASELGVGATGIPRFRNGRHRLAWLRDNGYTRAFVAVDPKDAKRIKALFGA